MNTLPKQHASVFFATHDDYLNFRRHWSQLVNSERRHELKAAHHLLYLVLTGRDWRKAFTFPSSPNKLNNGYTPELYQALDLLGSTYRERQLLAPFDGLVTAEMLANARRLLGHVLGAYPRGEAGGHPDCDAYIASPVDGQER